MFITWKISRLVSLDRYVADVGFHHVDSLDAGAKHTVILEPNGNYEYSIEQKGSIALPAPYDTNCVDYKMFGKHPFYPAYMTQTLCMEECRMNITFLNCGCIMKTYPFRNKLDEVMCDDAETADCVLKRSKAIYDRVCREACRNPCEETTYDITLGYQGRESGVPFNGYYYLNMKLTIPVRYVAILKTIPMHTSTTVLAVIGGYLGFWLGLSMYSGVTKILLRVQAIIAKRMKDRLTRARSHVLLF
ncbi:degenerin deg-1-like [Dermacentor silvarum]|uniref:degenerin deg-1-like n=1 Tax=Dermacentor silvarum TaxID=543639 RepID=UPI00210123C6|nr:degenerin deg-1-like [Dermacentor silvarum]